MIITIDRLWAALAALAYGLFTLGPLIILSRKLSIFFSLSVIITTSSAYTRIFIGTPYVLTTFPPGAFPMNLYEYIKGDIPLSCHATLFMLKYALSLLLVLTTVRCFQFKVVIIFTCLQSTVVLEYLLILSVLLNQMLYSSQGSI